MQSVVVFLNNAFGYASQLFVDIFNSFGDFAYLFVFGALFTVIVYRFLIAPLFHSSTIVPGTSSFEGKGRRRSFTSNPNNERYYD